jgi:hypothetical protein
MDAVARAAFVSSCEPRAGTIGPEPTDRAAHTSNVCGESQRQAFAWSRMEMIGELIWRRAHHWRSATAFPSARAIPQQFIERLMGEDEVADIERILWPRCARSRPRHRCGDQQPKALA